MKRCLSSWVRWIPVVLWMTMIFAGSTDMLSSRRTSRFIGPVLRWLKPDVTEEQIRFVQLIVRKAGHLTEYAILAALILRALGEMESRRALRFAVLLSVAYAASDELHQSFVSTRQGSVWDAVIDTTGALIGASLWQMWRRRLSGKVKPFEEASDGSLMDHARRKAEHD